MKTILHSDYWCEIPAGEFLVGGFSPSQEEWVAARITEQYHEGYYPYWKKHQYYLTEQKTAYLDTFYISRFPITLGQVKDYWGKGISAVNLPGALEYPDVIKGKLGKREVEVHARHVTNILHHEELCKELGARLPSSLEWEKAARGTDGRLYPWGNEWDTEAGYFYPGNGSRSKGSIDDFPRGVSPYGVYGLLGYLPQKTSDGLSRGCEPRETTPETAWIDNIIPLAHKQGDYLSLRPVLDKWPVQQWTGHTFTVTGQGTKNTILTESQANKACTRRWGFWRDSKPFSTPQPFPSWTAFRRPPQRG